MSIVELSGRGLTGMRERVPEVDGEAPEGSDSSWVARASPFALGVFIAVLAGGLTLLPLLSFGARGGLPWTTVALFSLIGLGYLTYGIRYARRAKRDESG